MVQRLDEIIARVPGWSNARSVGLQFLSGGVTNKNYRVEVDGERYVLRFSGSNTRYLGIDRLHEYQATVAAARIGIGPEVIAFLEPEGHLVTRFIEGRTWTWGEIREPDVIERIARVLKHIHALPTTQVTLSPFRMVEHYTRTARELGVAFPDNLDWLLSQMYKIETAEQAAPIMPCFCHNDVVRRNFIDDGTVRIVDWEYAGMGNPYFDLATVAANHEYTLDQELLLLEQYFGSAPEHHKVRLSRMKCMFFFRDATWSLVQSAIATVDFDYLRLARIDFEKLTREMNTLYS